MLERVFVALIRAYQIVLSPWVGHGCRYLPTCSEYSLEAIERHGALRGGWMMLARLGRCHPLGGRGLDPVPARFRWRCWCAEPHHADAARSSLFTEPR